MPAPAPRVLVIGGNSFIARNCIAGREVLASSRSGPVRCDVGCPSNLREVIAQARPDFVLNFATYGNFRFQTDPSEMWRTNVLGPRNLVDVLAEAFPGTRLIHFGSYSEYGLTDSLMSERDREEPVSTYGYTKLAGTRYVELAYRLFGLRTLVLRVNSVYGPHEQSCRLFPTLFRKLAVGDEFELWNGEVARDFTWVEDIADVVWQFIDGDLCGAVGQVVNLSSGTQTTVRDAVQTFCEVVGPVQVRDLHRPPEQTDSPRSQGDIRKLQALLGGHAFTPLGEGLRQMRCWYAERSDPRSYP
jgi:nucleoside-diphosphate-sugar epimerase